MELAWVLFNGWGWFFNFLPYINSCIFTVFVESYSTSYRMRVIGTTTALGLMLLHGTIVFPIYKQDNYLPLCYAETLPDCIYNRAFNLPQSPNQKSIRWAWWQKLWLKCEILYVRPNTQGSCWVWGLSTLTICNHLPGWFLRWRRVLIHPAANSHVEKGMEYHSYGAFAVLESF